MFAGPVWDARAAHREDSVTYSHAEQYRKPKESLEGNRYRKKASRLQECKAEGSRPARGPIGFLSSEKNRSWRESMESDFADT
jgi:hypothetical protein